MPFPIDRTRGMAPSKNYVNNRQLYECIADYALRRRELEAAGKPRPPIPDYAGECIYMICNRMGTRYNFRGYSFREDMVGDAIADCVYGFYLFDPDRFRNPFGYFTQIAWMAMVRKISTEKKQTYLKYKSLQNAYLAGETYDSPEGYSESGGVRASSDGTDWMAVMDQIVSDFETGIEKKKRKSQEKKAEKPPKQEEPRANTVLAFAEENPR